jgi:hypothetical protein
MAGMGVIAAAGQTVDYERDLRGERTEWRLTVGTLTFNHWYEYTGRGLLARVYSSETNNKPEGNPDAVYSYWPSGAVATRRYAGGPEVPLLYTVREELETVGDPSGTASPFSGLVPDQTAGFEGDGANRLVVWPWDGVSRPTERLDGGRRPGRFARSHGRSS